jgi:hypothetical protein
VEFYIGGAKGVSVQTHDRGLPGELSIAMTSNRDERGDAALHEEVLRGACQEVLFARAMLSSGRADLSSLTARVRTSTKAGVLPC